MTSCIVIIETAHKWTCFKMCARDKRTATENFKCWSFILWEKNSGKPQRVKVGSWELGFKTIWFTWRHVSHTDVARTSNVMVFVIGSGVTNIIMDASITRARKKSYSWWKACLGFQFRRWIRTELYVRSRYASANEEVNVLRKYNLKVSRRWCSSVQKKWQQTYFGEQIAKFRFSWKRDEISVHLLF